MFACDEADMVTQGIEEQHKQLIEVTNQLYAGIATRRKIESLAVILDELLDCIHAHLSFEEYYLHRIGWRKHKTHKSVHDEVIVRVITFQTQVRAGDYEMAMDLGVLEILCHFRNIQEKRSDTCPRSSILIKPWRHCVMART